MEVGDRDQVLRNLDLHDPLLDQFIERVEIRVPPSSVSLYVHTELFWRTTT